MKLIRKIKILFDSRNQKNPYYKANEWGWQIDANGLRYSLIDSIIDITSHYLLLKMV